MKDKTTGSPLLHKGLESMALTGASAIHSHVTCQAASNSNPQQQQQQAAAGRTRRAERCCCRGWWWRLQLWRCCRQRTCGMAQQQQQQQGAPGVASAAAAGAGGGAFSFGVAAGSAPAAMAQQQQQQQQHRGADIVRSAADLAIPAQQLTDQLKAQGFGVVPFEGMTVVAMETLAAAQMVYKREVALRYQQHFPGW
ncbi:hypothetical protein COO60DRAFT_1150644 [Scenedesmus sp. NREL 46B-D3]|nr:hypothetical protein COO60DRAFT_1150644 [Scenedesmus sp. NREL 46B-D3]